MEAVKAAGLEVLEVTPSGRMGICNSEKRNESVGREDQKRCIIFL